MPSTADARLPALAEGLEDDRQVLGGDALAGVLDLEHRRSCSAPRRTATRPPAGVNFSALEIRLPVICCRRAPSPHIGSGSAGSVVDRAGA